MSFWKKAGSWISRNAKSVVKDVKKIAPKAASWVGGAVGSLVAPGVGTALGAKLGGLVGNAISKSSSKPSPAPPNPVHQTPMLPQNLAAPVRISTSPIVQSIYKDLGSTPTREQIKAQDEKKKRKCTFICCWCFSWVKSSKNHIKAKAMKDFLKAFDLPKSKRKRKFRYTLWNGRRRVSNHYTLRAAKKAAKAFGRRARVTKYVGKKR